MASPNETPYSVGMTARMVVSSAEVTGPEGSGLAWTKVMAETRDGKLLVRKRSGQVLYSVDATAVTMPSRGLRLVETTEGTFTVKRGCGCGG